MVVVVGLPERCISCPVVLMNWHFDMRVDAPILIQGHCFFQINWLLAVNHLLETFIRALREWDIPSNFNFVNIHLTSFAGAGSSVTLFLNLMVVFCKTSRPERWCRVRHRADTRRPFGTSSRWHFLFQCRSVPFCVNILANNLRAGYNWLQWFFSLSIGRRKDILRYLGLPVSLRTLANRIELLLLHAVKNKFIGTATGLN